VDVPAGELFATLAGVDAAKQAWRWRVENLFHETPIPFRRQNGGDYPDGHVLAGDVAVGQRGFTAHISRERESPDALVLT
jgi:NAD(P)H dehydrogenase (quinone)